MLGRYIKGGVLVLALVVLVVEGFFVYRWYERNHGPAVAASDGGPALEGTAPGEAAEKTAAEDAGDAPTGPVAFAHRATQENSRGDYTYLDDPRINGDPDAVVLAAPADDYGHNIGVWFEPRERRWAVFNQDRAAVPVGATFEVTVPAEDGTLVHEVTDENVYGDTTYVDDPLLNGRPDLDVSVTQNWNPGGGGGVYNDRPVGALYDGDVDRWFVYNEDGAPMPEGAAFNVSASGDG